MSGTGSRPAIRTRYALCFNCLGNHKGFWSSVPGMGLEETNTCIFYCLLFFFRTLGGMYNYLLSPFTAKETEKLSNAFKVTQLVSSRARF